MAAARGLIDLPKSNRAVIAHLLDIRDGALGTAVSRCLTPAVTKKIIRYLAVNDCGLACQASQAARSSRLAAKIRLKTVPTGILFWRDIRLTEYPQTK